MHHTTELHRLGAFPQLTRWECHCGTNTEVKLPVHIVEQHEQPNGRYCPASFGIVNETAVQLFALCDAEHPEQPGVICQRYKLSHGDLPHDSTPLNLPRWACVPGVTW